MDDIRKKAREFLFGATPPGQLRAGSQPTATASGPAIPFGAWGRCSKCNCRAFEGKSNTCANPGCGHAYSDHYQ